MSFPKIPSGLDSRAGPRLQAEAELLAALIRDPALLAGVPSDLPLGPMPRELLRGLADAVRRGIEGEEARVSGLFALASEDSGMASTLAGIVSCLDRIHSPGESVRQTIRFLLRDTEEQALRALKSRLRQAQESGDEAVALRLKREIFEQIRKTRQTT